MRRSVTAMLSTSLLLTPMLAGAVRFPDVPGDHPYNSSVEALAIEGVVTGNPDGNFYPARPVNRAEFLTMLYRAKKKSSNTVSTSCFSDVQASAWYAKVVCDAVVHGYVKGYPDGSFKPEQSVNRVEVLKMIYKLFELGVLTGDEANAAADQFVDVQAGQWYTVFVSSSYRNGLLPIPGYSGNKFYPTNAVLRGEAAAYIWRAMNITGEFTPTETEEEESSSSAASTSSRAQQEEEHEEDPTTHGSTTTRAVDFPFSDDGDVAGYKTLVYTFPLEESTDLQVDVKLGTGGSQKGVSCRLFLLGENGLSEQYYLGWEDEALCQLRVSAPKGNYQLEVMPDDPKATYTISVKTTKSDGNDGFDEAVALAPSTEKAGQIPQADIADWYTFKLTMKGKHTVTATGNDVSCDIFPLNDVDLFGFASPVCGEEFDYQKGTYMVRMQRKNGVTSSLSYTVKLD